MVDRVLHRGASSNGRARPRMGRALYLLLLPGGVRGPGGDRGLLSIGCAFCARSFHRRPHAPAGGRASSSWGEVAPRWDVPRQCRSSLGAARRSFRCSPGRRAPVSTLVASSVRWSLIVVHVASAAGATVGPSLRRSRLYSLALRKGARVTRCRRGGRPVAAIVPRRGRCIAMARPCSRRFAHALLVAIPLPDRRHPPHPAQRPTSHCCASGSSWAERTRDQEARRRGRAGNGLRIAREFARRGRPTR